MKCSIGSVSHLVTGSTTPNKKKVAKKKFIKACSVLEGAKTAVISIESTKKKKVSPNRLIETEQNVEKKKKKALKRKMDDIKLNDTEEGEKKPKKLKKRKPAIDQSTIMDSDDKASEQKKTKLNKNVGIVEGRVKKTVKKVTEPSPEELARTIFVGNVPLDVTRKEIKRHYRLHGKIELLKTRKNISETIQANSTVYYIRFKNKKSAVKAEAAENGVIFRGHHQRVHLLLKEKKPDESKTIFVRNIRYDTTEDELWNLFEPCGPIEYVRIPLVHPTLIGRGIGYVNFKNSESLQLALKMDNNVKLKDRDVRIYLCNYRRPLVTKQAEQVSGVKQTKLQKNRQAGSGKVNRKGKKFTGKLEKNEVNNGGVVKMEVIDETINSTV